MKYRIATPEDYSTIARIHYYSGQKQAGSFIPQLGINFLREYYKIHFKDENSIILVAEDEGGNISGFVSGTTSCDKFLSLLRKNKLRLFISTLPVLLRNPGILMNLKKRYDFVNHKENCVQYGVTSGARIDYWAWDADSRSKTSVFLFKAWLDMVFEKDTNCVKGEIDTENSQMINLCTFLGARIIHECKLPDGRTRLYIEFVNKKNNMPVN